MYLGQDALSDQESAMNAIKAVGFSVLLAALLGPPTPVRAAALTVQDYQGVRYVTGGVGQDERDYLNSVQHQFNLVLMFAARGGAYLSNVHVVIQDSRGNTALDAVADGPYFYAALPPGSYAVSASANDQTQRRRINLRAGTSSRTDFYWK